MGKWELTVRFYSNFPQILQKPHLRLKTVKLSETEHRAVLLIFAHNSKPNLDLDFIVIPICY